MLTVYLTKGLPASGKSSWAKSVVDKNPNMYKRVNKDDLRLMLDNSCHSDSNEKFVLKIRDSIIEAALNDGKHVIVDDCNLAEKHEIRIREIVKKYNASVSIQDFTHIPLDVCIERDSKRNNPVGKKVIYRMYKQFLMKTEIYNEDKTLPKAIIVDIDGTLAHMNDGRSPFEWSKVKQDSCNEVVKELVNAYSGNVIIFSGRDAICRAETEEWLNENNVKFNQLFMRDVNNAEKDSIIKRRLFEEHIRGKYYVEYVIDDRLSVCRMWHQMGLHLFRVGDPDADF